MKRLPALGLAAALSALPLAAETAGAAPPSAFRAAPPPAAGDAPVQGHASDHPLSIPVPDHPAVRRFLDYYSSRDALGYLAEIMRRAEPYRRFIAGMIAEMGLPYELLYLPLMESDYSCKAVSSSGAAGLWQFMTNSIGGYGIRIDEWVDERKDFWKSTVAALRKLKANYEQFGDWCLALAAYNCGDGLLSRAVKKSGLRDYWALLDAGWLPKETAGYVPKFLAISTILSEAGRRGIEPRWPEPVEWVRVPLDRAVDLAMLAESAGIDAAALRAANPELRYGVTPPGDVGYALKARPEWEGPLTAALADKGLALMRFYVRKVRSGDTVYALARHYGVPAAMIARYNPGLRPDLIRIGQTILIPAFKEAPPYEPAAPKPAAGPVPAFGGSYVVKKGDTLWSISLRYGVAPETLAEKNGLALAAIIREGMKLSVPIMSE